MVNGFACQVNIVIYFVNEMVVSLSIESVMGDKMGSKVRMPLDT